MTQRLRWRQAESRDRPALEAFTCTEPRKKDWRGRPLPVVRRWERAVEVGIRQLTPPVGDGILLLGHDDEGLAAVVLMYDDEGKDGDVYRMKLAGVAVAWRCQGKGYAAEAAQAAQEAAADRGFGRGCHYVRLVGPVHRSNAASRAACARAGFQELGEAFVADHDEWGVTLELPPEVRLD